MKRIFRITTGALLIIIGLGITVLSVYALLLHARDLTSATLFLSALLAGIAIILAGTALARGESIRNLLHDLLSAFYF